MSRDVTVPADVAKRMAYAFRGGPSAPPEWSEWADILDPPNPLLDKVCIAMAGETGARDEYVRPRARSVIALMRQEVAYVPAGDRHLGAYRAAVLAMLDEAATA